MIQAEVIQALPPSVRTADPAGTGMLKGGQNSRIRDRGKRIKSATGHGPKRRMPRGLSGDGFYGDGGR
jgi:hypothetical protein